MMIVLDMSKIIIWIAVNARKESRFEVKPSPQFGPVHFASQTAKHNDDTPGQLVP